MKRLLIALAVTAFALLPLGALGWFAVLGMVMSNNLQGVAGMGLMGGYALLATVVVAYVFLRILMFQVKFLLLAGIVALLMLPVLGYLLFGLST